MYAVVRHGGRQYKVSKGDTVVLDRVSGEVGEELILDDVVLVRDDKVWAGSDASKAQVVATIVEHFKGDKVLVFKFKPKKNYHRTYGHRQYLTKVKIDDISLAKPARKKAAKVEAAEVVAQEAPPAEIEAKSE